MAREELKLENQLCFPLYACSRAITRAYAPLLEQANLTYTQYLTMMALWEYGTTSVKELGQRLLLDSGTLTPLLKKLEARGLITRSRDAADERKLVVSLTPAGEALEDVVADVPRKMACNIELSADEGRQLVTLLYQIIGDLTELPTDES